MSDYAQFEFSRSPPKVNVPRQYNATSEFIDRHVEQGRGDSIALIDDCGSYSYAELHARVNKAGNALMELGVEAESRVVLCLLDSVDFPSGFFGTLKIGAIALPINTLLTSTDYDFMLRDSRAA